MSLSLERKRIGGTSNVEHFEDTVIPLNSSLLTLYHNWRTREGYMKLKEKMKEYY